MPPKKYLPLSPVLRDADMPVTFFFFFFWSQPLFNFIISIRKLIIFSLQKNKRKKKWKKRRTQHHHYYYLLHHNQHNKLFFIVGFPNWHYLQLTTARMLHKLYINFVDSIGFSFHYQSIAFDFKGFINIYFVHYCLRFVPKLIGF